MRTTRLYHPEALSGLQHVTLTQTASHHLATVLRASIGEPVILFNGDGCEYRGTLEKITKKMVSIALTEKIQPNRESSLKVHLGQGLCRGEKMDWVLQKAVELGVTEITPLSTEHSNVKLDTERAQKKAQHWQQIVISACEQSGRTIIPTLNPITPLSLWLTHIQADAKWVLNPHKSKTVTTPPKLSSIALLIGPEGGLSTAEVTAANDTGFDNLQLGPRVLRTETAPLAALAFVQTRWGDMSPLP